MQFRVPFFSSRFRAGKVIDQDAENKLKLELRTGGDNAENELKIQPKTSRDDDQANYVNPRKRRRRTRTIRTPIIRKDAIVELARQKVAKILLNFAEKA